MNLAKLQQDGPLAGHYRMHSSRWHRDGGEHHPAIQLVLEDMSGCIAANIWHLRSDLELPLEWSCVEVEGQVRMRRDGPVADVEFVWAATKPEAETIRLIPRSLCPKPWLLAFLDAFVLHLQTPWLKQFVLDVLGDDFIAFAFVSCPASLRYHHNFPGGLLYHSVECMQMVARYREFSPEDRELGMVAALFHDIGKILTLTPQMKRTTLGATLDHDKLTLEVLSPALRRLDESCPQGGVDLRYLLTWRRGRQDSGIPRTPLANAVLGADRVSAGIG